MRYVIFFIYLLATYLIGGIPFGLMMGKVVKGIDIRNYGSKNIGATNVARVLGKWYGILVLFLDGAKGFFPVMLAKAFWPEHWLVLVLLCAVFGHIFSFWLKGKGGKGIATMFFGLLGFNPVLGATMLIVWLSVFKKTKISSLSALCSIVAVILVSIFIQTKQTTVTLTIIVAVIFWAHRNNISRLLAGEELGFANKNSNNNEKN